MIARLWKGRVKLEDAEEYRAYQQDVGPSGYERIPGNRGIYVLGRVIGDEYEIAMLTFWDSIDSVRHFAGDPVDRAKYYDRDFDYLIDPPETVDHYEIVLVAKPL